MEQKVSIDIQSQEPFWIHLNFLPSPSPFLQYIIDFQEFYVFSKVTITFLEQEPERF